MIEEAAIWDAYNTLLLGPDIERIRKLLVRYELFRRTIEVPGDIVECGVLKGSSLLFFLKLLHIFCHGSNKKVVGFDMFEMFPAVDNHDAAEVERFVAEAGFVGVSPESLMSKVRDAGFASERCQLIQGDICQTAADYVANNPGLRISLLHLDLDLDSPTYAALEAFWPRVVKGGVVILDEYAVSRWSESNGVDRYFKEREVQIRTLPWSRTPTAYLIKDYWNA